MTTKERIQHHCNVSEWYWRQAEHTTTDFGLTAAYVKTALAAGVSGLELARGDKELAAFAKGLFERLDTQLPRSERVRQVTRLILEESAGAAQERKQQAVAKLDEVVKILQEALKK